MKRDDKQVTKQFKISKYRKINRSVISNLADQISADVKIVAYETYIFCCQVCMMGQLEMEMKTAIPLSKLTTFKMLDHKSLLMSKLTCDLCIGLASVRLIRKITRARLILKLGLIRCSVSSKR